MARAGGEHSKRRQAASRNLPPGKLLAWKLSSYEDATVLLDPRVAIERRLQRLRTDLERCDCCLTWRPTPTADREVLAPDRCRDLKLPSPGKAPNLP